MTYNNICLRPLEEIVILSDGRITSCCVDTTGNNSFANIYKDDYETAILSKFKTFKQKMAQNLASFKVCVNCFKNNLDYYVFKDFHIKKPSANLRNKFLSDDAIPRQLVIELTSLCNLECSACMTGNKTIGEFRGNNKSSLESIPLIKKILPTKRNDSNGRLLDINTLKSWLKPNLNDIDSIRLYNYGETFLHPDSIDFCSFLTSENPSMFIDIATNGLLLNSQVKIEGIVKSQPSILTFSIHGASQESLEKYMGKNADFNIALNVMKALIAERNKHKFNLPIIVWKYILFDWNDTDDEMNKAKSIAKTLGIDYLYFELTKGCLSSKRFVEGSKDYEELINSTFFSGNFRKIIFPTLQNIERQILN